jgi:hypothetical protein
MKILFHDIFPSHLKVHEILMTVDEIFHQNASNIHQLLTNNFMKFPEQFHEIS